MRLPARPRSALRQGTVSAALALHFCGCVDSLEHAPRADASHSGNYEADAGSLVTSDASGRGADASAAPPRGFQVHLSASAELPLCRGACVELSARAEQGVPPYHYEFDQGLGAGATHRVCPTADTTYRVDATDESFDVEFGRRNGAVSEALTIRVSDCASPGADASVDAASWGIDASGADASGSAEGSVPSEVPGDMLPRQASVLCAKPVATIDTWAGGSFDLWNEEFATKIAVDKSGSARIASTLTGTARVTNGPTLKSGEVLMRSVLVAKVGPDCLPAWATLLHGFSELSHPIVAVDSQGRTILFALTKTDEAVGTTEALYLASLSADGALLWEKRLAAATTGLPYQRALRIDANDDIVIMSAAQGASDFGAGPIANTGSADGAITVLAKYRPSGACVWSKLLQASATGGSLAIHNGTDILLHGWSDTALDWGAAGTTSSTQAAQGHGYLVRADALGSFVSSKVITDGATTAPSRVHNLDSVAPDRLVLSELPAANQLSVAQLDGSIVWSQPVVDTSISSSLTWNESAVDAQGNIILSGNFDDTTRVRGVTLRANERSVEASFVQKVDSRGRTVWTFLSDAVLSEPAGFETHLGAVPDAQGNVFMLMNAFYAKKNALYVVKLAN